MKLNPINVLFSPKFLDEIIYDFFSKIMPFLMKHRLCIQKRRKFLFIQFNKLIPIGFHCISLKSKKIT